MGDKWVGLVVDWTWAGVTGWWYQCCHVKVHGGEASERRTTGRGPGLGKEHTILICAKWGESFCLLNLLRGGMEPSGPALEEVAELEVGLQAFPAHGCHNKIVQVNEIAQGKGAM